MLNPRVIDETGKRHGRLVAIKYAGSRIKQNGYSHTAL